MKVKIEVEVNVEPVGNAARPSGYKFVSLSIGDGSPIPIPPDAPAPRRLARELAEAAGAALGGAKAAPQEQPGG